MLAAMPGPLLLLSPGPIHTTHGMCRLQCGDRRGVGGHSRGGRPLAFIRDSPPPVEVGRRPPGGGESRTRTEETSPRGGHSRRYSSQRPF